MISIKYSNQCNLEKAYFKVANSLLLFFPSHFFLFFVHFFTRLSSSPSPSSCPFSVFPLCFNNPLRKYIRTIRTACSCLLLFFFFFSNCQGCLFLRHKIVRKLKSHVESNDDNREKYDDLFPSLGIIPQAQPTMSGNIRKYWLPIFHQIRTPNFFSD